MMLLKRPFFLFTSLFFLSLSGCKYTSEIDPTKITSINIIDRNGMTETISSKDKLEGFQNTNFLNPQPYQKVLRLYGKDEKGGVRSCITSYHPNGQIKQYLNALNNRASGVYKEWHSNGNLKIESHIIGGIADLNNQAEESWLFEGVSKAWDEDGKLLAEIFYQKGELEGESKYYHSNGDVWKVIPYSKNLRHGTEKFYLENGELFQISTYQNGLKEGISIRYWTPLSIAYQENYKASKLIESKYFNKEGECISEIHEGNGFRAILGKNQLHQLQEYRDGIPEGAVKIFDGKGFLVRVYSIKNGEKNGEEIGYFSSSTGCTPKFLITWKEGQLQGMVKTWFENGTVESQKEMSHNKKNGLFTAWYHNGSLMLVEEYDNDQLIKGEYYRLGEKVPISKIEKGKGVVTLFDAEGAFSKKIHYQDGKPIE
jgi:antitoxin component YwqK of YwqJK toxin-antitoxin module